MKEALVNKPESSASYTQVHHSDTLNEEDQRELFVLQQQKQLNLKEKQKQSYKEYGFRWVVLFQFSIAVLINGIAYETCIPISKQIHDIYEVSDSVISLTATMYMFMHPIFTFASSQLIIKYGFAFTVKLGCAFTIAGFAFRLLINYSFYLVVVGQIFCGIGRPMILNAQASLAQNWFFPQHRTVILTFINIVLTLSIVLSLTIPGNIMFKNYDPKVDDGKKLTFNLMFVEFCSNVLLLPAFFILKTSPKTPPSAFANTDSAVAFMQAIKALFKNKSFILLFISNSIYFGSLKGLGVVIPYILEPFGFSTGQISLTGSSPIIGGLFSSLLIGVVVKKVGKYQPIIIVLMILSASLCAVLSLCVITEKSWLVYLDTFMLGFFLVPLIPVMVVQGCELIYPVSGSFAVGIMFSGATLLTVISSQLLTIITKGNNSDHTSSLVGIFCIVGILVVGLICQIFVKEVKNRSSEIQQRLKQSTVFFKSVHQQGQQSKVKSDLLNSIGDYPTYHPFVDQQQFISDPQVFNPDYVQDIQKSIIKESSNKNSADEIK